MKKIIVSFVLLFTISLFSIQLFAATVNTDVKTNTENMKNSVLNTVNGTKNAAMNVSNSVGNGISDAKNAVVGSTEKAKNSIVSTGNAAMNTMENIGNMDNNYNAQRTAADATVLGMTTNTWTWLILAIVGLAIVSLVWYYGAQYEHKDFDNE